MKQGGMKKAIFTGISGIAAAMILIVTGYAEEKKGALDGAKLYDEHCSRCHFSIRDSIRGGRTMARIKSSLKRPVHDGVPNLTDEQVEAISKALRDVEF